MKIVRLNPNKSLNKGFLKQRLQRSCIDLFKSNLIRLLDKVDEIEREENQKNHIRDFLRDTYYINNYEINTKDNKDLVIHSGKTNKEKVAVIIEAKRPGNKTEMITLDRPNVKAFQELVLYFLRERIEENNIDIKFLIATNVYEWYIFDASYFEKLFYRNKTFVRQYEDWRDGKKVTKDTSLFYNEIAKPFIENLEDEIPCTYFDIRNYEKILRNENNADDISLIALQKLLSPHFLLSVPYASDSNLLNEKFYKELLYIIGLEEVKEGTKNIIRRRQKEKQPGALIENVINILITEDTLFKVKDKSLYGHNKDEQLFGVALELSLTWINRMLFLKLLEGQLVAYHKNNDDYRFLKSEMIQDFDELYKLFHQVLARNIDQRTPSIQLKYARIPYLNSSLFEISELEDATLKINSLDNSETIELIGATILTEEKKKNHHLPALEYLLKFLDAYDFSTEDAEDIAEDNKTIINASVLGKVFEKINGYKDGSIFTPGFITMYMSRQALRLAVIQKFNEYFKTRDISEAATFEELYNRIDKIEIKTANRIINSLRICDPAVGSGHFLVSCLNELIVIKSELGILIDDNGKRLRDYEIVIENDELIISDDSGIFRYNFLNKESRRVQETIFHERQTIIENCLFGVDINPNSVKICRLRLWIELLKNAYYKEPGFTQLETLPNIDINIKSGNSLLNRFPIDADLSKALKSIKYDIKAYRGFVADYKNEKSREVKRGLQKIIDGIKSDFRSEIYNSDPKFIRLNKLGGELYSLLNQTRLIEENEKQKEARKAQQQKIEIEINDLSKEIDDIKTNGIYKNAFEWRFEFPEVLNDNGDFERFDVMIGNPPYFSISTNEKLRVLANKYQTYVQTGDIYALFYELGLRIIKTDGIQSLITSNKWMRTNYGLAFRKFILEKSNPLSLIDFGQNLIFDHAIVHANIITALKSPNKNQLSAIRFEDNKFFDFVKVFGEYAEKHKIENLQFDENPWNIIKNNVLSLKQKIEARHKPLKNWNIRFNRGLLTGLNEAFIIDGKLKEQIATQEPQSEKFIKPILRGRDTRPYYADFKNFWILNIPKGFTIKTKFGISNVVFEPMPRYGNIEQDEAWDWFREKHPVVAEHLFRYKFKAEKRDDQGDYWWELRACSYISEFEKPKIIFSEIVSEPQFYYDEKGFYPEATVFFITGERLKYLTALLNSKAVTFFFKSFYMGGELVGKIRYKKAFLELVPIPEPTDEQELQIIDLVNQILVAKEKRHNTATLEKQIDRMVYGLYELTKDEIEIVEGGKL